MLEHIESGCTLNQEKTVSPNGQYNVCLVYSSGSDELTTPWKITFNPVATRTVLKFGSLVRFHDEQAGFLRAFGNIVRARNYNEADDHNQSYKTVWEIVPHTDQALVTGVR